MPASGATLLVPWAVPSVHQSWQGKGSQRVKNSVLPRETALPLSVVTAGSGNVPTCVPSVRQTWYPPAVPAPFLKYASPPAVPMERSMSGNVGSESGRVPASVPSLTQTCAASP